MKTHHKRLLKYLAKNPGVVKREEIVKKYDLSRIQFSQIMVTQLGFQCVDEVFGIWSTGQ